MQIQENPELPLKASLFTVFLSILFGANAVAVKITFSGIGVFSCAALRFGLAAAVISIWAVCTGRSLRISRQQGRQLLVVSFLFTAQVALFYSGLNRTTASHGILIANFLPFVVLLLAHFFIPGEIVTGRKAIGILLGFSGVLILVSDTQGVDASVRSGDFIILCAVLFWGVNAVYIKRIIAVTSPVKVTLYPMLLAVPCLLLAGCFFDGGMVRHIDIPIGFSLFYQSFITASFGYIAWNTLVSKYGTALIHSYVFIMPVSGVFFGVVLLGEPLTLSLLGSIIFIALGIVVINQKSR
jgi:drug/metabolite transporter (DMT)-like permease